MKSVARRVLKGRRSGEGDFEAHVFRDFLLSPFFDRERAATWLGHADFTDAALEQAYRRTPLDERPSFSVYFDPGFYRRKYADVRRMGTDPQLHFFLHGFRERRSPHPLIDIGYLEETRPDLFRNKGSFEMLPVIVADNLASTSPYLDLQFYRKTNALAEGESVFLHFAASLEEDRAISPYFSSFFYRSRYPDVPPGGFPAFSHFVEIGDREARRASDSFDAEWYLNFHQDIRATLYGPLYHYLRYGIREGRAFRRIAGRGSAGHGIDARQQASQLFQAGGRDIDLAGYADLKARVADIRRARIEQVLEEDLRVCRFEGDLPFDRLSFQTSEAPRLSIIVPVYNGLRETFECLWSVMLSPPAAPYEIILADDASPDIEVGRFAEVLGLSYFRQEENLGFLRNCNVAFAKARGAFVLVLNSDTQVLPGALDRLHEAVRDDERVGIAGPMFLYPNGRIQEAGGLLHDDGTTDLVGLAQAASEPAFHRSHDVSYCSGAALLVRREAVEGELFDPAFAPAYCEDVDLCLRVAARGYRVRYCAEARILHHLSVSMRKGAETARVQLAFANQLKLLDKWGDTLARDNEVRVLAFYLPQFHPVPENDLWWGRGFTEWRNVGRARPRYVDHYQPHVPADLGYYDLRQVEVMGEQFNLARRYGIEGFCVYHYDFSGRRVLSAPIDNLLKRPDIDFPFCLCWANENWTKHWDGGSKEILLAQSYDQASNEKLAADLVEIARDHRYIQVNGRPLVLIYRPLLLPNPQRFSQLLRDAFRNAGFAGLHLAYVESMETLDAKVRPQDIGFDACVEFPPQKIGVSNAEPTPPLDPDWRGLRYSYGATAENAVLRQWPGYVRYPGVFPSWDNTPRQPQGGSSFDNASPEIFQAYCEEKMLEAKALHHGDERLVFVNAWNEWAEGAHLEPDLAFGHRWLEAIRRAFAGAKARPRKHKAAC